MANNRSSWGLVAAFAMGAAALVLARVPAVWPNPLEHAAGDPRAAARRLSAAAHAVDAACQAGDERGFVAVTTAAYRRDLARRLAVVDQGLDGTTLRALSAGAGCEPWFERPVLGAAVQGDRVAVAVLREHGDGAQLLRFVWDGRSFRFDGARHAPAVRDAAAAQRALDASWPAPAAR